MHVAIDASRTTVPRLTGTERYALELIRALIRLDSPHQFTLYFRDTPSPDLLPTHPNVIHRVIPFRRAWTHLRFAAAIWQDRPDITFVPAHTLPFVFPGWSVVTVHDLGYKYFPEAHPLRSRLYLDLTTRYSAARARVVLADSQATADDLTRFYNTAASKIHVVHPGVQAPAIVDEAVRPKYGLPERYFLFIGTLQPRKNIARIVQAYAKYREGEQNPAGLVLVGKKGWLFDEQWINGVEGVILPGYVDEADKGKLFAEAVALVFPTLYEGFGFPVVEAMHCGTPVIASNTSSLPELVGEAGVLVDPSDVDAIAEAMQRLDSDSDYRAGLIQAGTAQAQQFTWDRAAEKTLIALEVAAE